MYIWTIHQKIYDVKNFQNETIFQCDYKNFYDAKRCYNDIIDDLNDKYILFDNDNTDDMEYYTFKMDENTYNYVQLYGICIPKY